MAILGMGDSELLVILAIVLLLFGATAIPKLARGLGQAKGEFARAKKDFDAQSAQAETAPASDEQVRATARSLGIDEAGKTPGELRNLIQQKLA